MRRRRGSWTHGEFKVMRVEPYDLEAGTRTDTVTGRLLLDGRRAAVVSVTRTTTAATSPPQPGTRVPARWRGDRPRRVRVDWSDEGMIAHVARLERDRRAAALGVDPATLTADPVPPGTRPRDAVVMWSHNGALLPDGTAPVFVDEADRIKRHGRPTEAVIAAIDFLAPLPGTTPSGASIANVALDVDAEDGGTYRVLARFGFRTPARRQQIGHPGARIPVRVDRRDHTRVVLDATRLPES